MNIKQAKEEISNAITAYFSKDEFGNYAMPIEKQRPLFLMGPPGIGKTAIMQQVAAEHNVALLSYSMTHHTRQSAMGLPDIATKTFQGVEYEVTEYTMSEIISSVYEVMENTGIKEGILFLDEINCVSETLKPIMLQFLQYKVFGKHRVPDGWIVVTAGNPPEYNDNVRDYDIATWDRLKRIDVTADYDCWREYAINRGVHPAILTYLDINKKEFYSIATTENGKEFATARGWEDLSQIIVLYEKNNIPVTEDLIFQYIQERRIAKRFATYYDLFNKYQGDYQIYDILDGKASDVIKNRAMNAGPDERLSVIGLMVSAITQDTKEAMLQTDAFTRYMELLAKMKIETSKLRDPIEVMGELANEIKDEIDKARNANNLSDKEYWVKNHLISTLAAKTALINGVDDADKAHIILFKDYQTDMKKDLESLVKKTSKRMSNMFKFCVEVFGDEESDRDPQELVIIVTELTNHNYSARFIGMYGCPEYSKHNKSLRLTERNQQIENAINDLGDDWADF